MQARQMVWMLIPIAGVSMLAVLFMVLWQALAQHTTTINRIQQRLADLEQRLEENPSVGSKLLEQQLQQLQTNQRDLEDRIGRMAQQQSELIELKQSLRQQARPAEGFDPFQSFKLEPSR